MGRKTQQPKALGLTTSVDHAYQLTSVTSPLEDRKVNRRLVRDEFGHCNGGERSEEEHKRVPFQQH